MLPGPSASEVMTLWRYTNLFIIIIVVFFVPQVVKIPGVKNYKSKNQNVGWSEVRQVNCYYYYYYYNYYGAIQCFDAVGWAARRASGL